LIATRDPEAVAATELVFSRVDGLDAKLVRVVSELAKLTDGLTVLVADAIRALQFEDMVNQLLGCAKQRIERFENVSRALSGLSDDAASSEVEEAMSALRHEATEAVYSPVSQSSVDGGDVVLF